MSTDAETIADLRRKLALRDVEIAEKKEEQEKATATFKTVLTLKNNEIKSLKDEIGKMKGANKQSAVKNASATMQSQLTRMEQGLALIDGKLNCFIRGTSQKTIRARFEEISHLTSKNKCSQSLKVAGIDWQLEISRKHFDGKDFLAIFLTTPNIESRCSAFFKFEVISHKPEQVAFSPKMAGATCVFEPGAKSWGYSRSIAFERLLNKKQKFVENDAIMVSVVIKVFPLK